MQPNATQRLAELESKLANLERMKASQSQLSGNSGQLPHDSSQKLAALEQQLAHLESLKKEREPIEPPVSKESAHGWGQSLKEVATFPNAVAGGVQDVLTYIPRKLGVNIPSSEQLNETFKTKPQTTLGKIAHTTGDTIGTTLPLAGVGSGVIKGAEHVLKNAPKAASRIGKVAEYTLGMIPKSADQAAKLGKYTVAGAGTAAALEHGADWSPLAANLAFPAAMGARVGAGYLGNKLVGPSKAAARTLREAIGEEETQKILEELAAAKSSNLPKGYKPSTAELSSDPTLIALERTHIGHAPESAHHHNENIAALHNTLEGVPPQGADFQDTLKHASTAQEGAQSAFESQLGTLEGAKKGVLNKLGIPESVSHKQHGEHLRSSLGNEVTRLENVRRQASAPLYKALTQSKENVNVGTTYDLLKELEESGLQGLIQGDVKAIKSALIGRTEKNLTPELKNLITSLKKENASPELIQSVLSQAEAGSGMATAKELHNILKDVIDKRMASSLKARDMSRYYTLNQIKSSLHDDLQAVPLFKKAQATYHQHSKPINKILADPGLSPILKQDIYKTEHTSRAASHLDKFYKGKTSEENAHALMKSIGKDTEAIDNLQAYIRHDFVADVVDANGKVNIGKLNHWKHQNQGAFVLDKKLSKVAHQLENQEKLIQSLETGHKATIAQTRELYDALLGGDSVQVVGRLLGSGKSERLMRDVIKLVKQDESGKALAGLQAGVMEHLKHRISLAGQTLKGDANLSYNALRGTMRRSQGALKELFGPEKFAEIESVFNALKSRNRILTAGSAVGSPTDTNKRLMNLLEDASSQAGVHLPPGLKQIGRWVQYGQKHYDQRTKKNLVELLLNPEKYREAMQGIKPSKSYNVSPSDLVRSSLLGYMSGKKEE